MNPLHFCLRSLGQFADVGPVGLIATVGHSVMDLWDASEDRAVNTALISERNRTVALISELDSKHQEGIERLTSKAESLIREKEEETREVMAAYKEDLMTAMIRIKELKGR